MSKSRERFEVGDRPRVEISTRSGDIFVAAGTAGEIELTRDGMSNRFNVSQHGDTIVVEPERGVGLAGATNVGVKVPAGTSVLLKATAGDVLVDVTVSDLEIGVAGGDVRVRDVTGNASIKSASGDTTIEHVAGRLVVATASGDTRIGRVGMELSLATASGDVVVDSIDGSVSLRTASGDVKVRRFDGPDLTAKSLSGNVTVGIPRRRRVDLDLQSLSGSLRNRLPESDGSPPEKSIRLRVKSVSGDLILTGA